MFSNLFNIQFNEIGFEDILTAIKEQERYIMLNTLSHNEQTVLIKSTIPSKDEETLINQIIDNQQMNNKTIIVYGKNACDKESENKYKKLKNCGFSNLAIYRGGLFEWLLLQEVYGFSNFPTSSKEIDILKYRPQKTFLKHLITY
jgi:hypothetical protein